MGASNMRVYNDGDSSVGNQLVNFYYQRKALIEAKKETYFGQLADTFTMPKNYGKTIKRYHYLPILDDANINDQGIDANGATTTVAVTIVVARSDNSIPYIPPYYGRSVANKTYFTGEGASASVAATAAIAKLVSWLTADDAVGGFGLAAADVDTNAEISALIVSGGSVYAAGYRLLDINGDAITDIGDLSDNSYPISGNLYGSSKDIGTVSGKLPALTETGGRVNRVGHKRIDIEGTLEKFGFFDEYTDESLNFDSDPELEQHIHREMINAANEMTEDMLQIDLLTNAGVVRYAGEALTLSEITGEDGATISEVTYDDLSRLSIDLDDNRCPKATKIITGSRMVDTKVIPAARIAYIGSALQRTLEKMVDHHGNPAFIPLAHYAAAGSEINGEIGTVGHFRFSVVPEMMHHAGAGATVTTNDGYRETDGAYDAYPILVVGNESFTTVGFQTSGKKSKFKIFHKKPGYDNANSLDPYGETGFMSIKWYYGFMALRPERIAVLWTVAQW